MTAYYNEHDPYAAQWLRNLISAGHIAPGVVDERSIEDVHPNDLRDFTQCHFFAGVGVWSYALRRAGWPDDRPVWTGSCPCQPFSAAGQGAGFDDARHLWPAFAWLIAERQPSVVFGEQVASKDAGPWVDLVQADVEAMGYAFGAIPFPAAGVGAPHIRDRLYWVADSDSGAGGQGRPNFRGRAIGSNAKPWARSSSSMPVGMADLHSDGRDQGRIGKPAAWDDGAERDSAAFRMGNTSSPGLDVSVSVSVSVSGIPGRASTAVKREASERAGVHIDRQNPGGPVNGLWADADWLFCRDGKWRPVEPGTFPLANGATSRVGRLRAYGNAINAEAAKEFIAAYLETLTTKGKPRP
jgi:DNA (cytosine-5)-methyltransferase 1